MILGFFSDRSRPPADQAIELTRSLTANPIPTLVMSLIFVGVGAFLSWRLGDRLLVWLLALGTLLSVVRLSHLLRMRAKLLQPLIDPETVEHLERHFAGLYISFAAVIGAFCARAIYSRGAHAEAIASVLVVGYAAGVAAGTSLRPKIAVASMLVAVLPIVCATFSRFELPHMVLAASLSAFLVGGLSSVATRYRGELDSIAMRKQLSQLAQHDSLTGLGNRLALADHFFSHRRGDNGACLIALHCLDLDGFKTINDRYGHPVGDALLVAVATRLHGLLRSGDLAIRLGSDEFALLQTRLQHADEANLTARRILRALTAPYLIDGATLHVGASLGFVVSNNCDDTLDTLVSKADNALYAIKREGGGVAEHSSAHIGKMLITGS